MANSRSTATTVAKTNSINNNLEKNIMHNPILKPASAMTPVSEILSTRKGLIAMSIQNDNRKMTVFNRLADIAMQVKKMIKPAVATIAIGVAFAGAFNTVEVNAQAQSPAIEVTGRFVCIGKNDPLSGGNIHALTFGQGVSGENFGLWHISSRNRAFYIGKVWNTDLTAIEDAISIQPNGTVGINNWNVTTTNNIKLDVSGLIRSSNGICQGSDRRYKKDIKPISNLDNLFKVNSVQFKPSTEALKEQLESFKQRNKNMDAQKFMSSVSDFERQIAEREADTVKQYGFIAQELRELYPELVAEDSEEYLAVDYIGMIPVLVDAIKVLKSEIDELRGKGFEKTATVISTAKLYQNNPNPFSENTEIKYYVPENANEAMICIYDLTGSQIVRFDLRDRGIISSFTVRGNQLKAGMYIYSLIVDGREIDTKRMILTDK